MLRRVLIALSLLTVAGGVAFLFYHNAHSTRVMLGQQSSVEAPVAAIVIGSIALGAILVLTGGLLTSSAGAWRGFLSRRRRRKEAELDRLAVEGRDAAWAGEHDAASRLLSRVVERRPEDLGAVLGLAEAYASRGETESAQRLLETARSRLGARPRLLAAIGELAITRRNPGAAADAFREATHVRPTSPRLLDGLARALEAEGRFGDAAATVQQLAARERDPAARSASAIRRLALRHRAALALADPAPRFEELRRLTTEAPDFLPPTVALADALATDGDLRGAEKILRGALRRQPRGVLVERLLVLQRADGTLDRIPGAIKDAAATSGAPAMRLAYARSLVLAGKLDLAETVVAEIPTSGETDALAAERALVRGELALARGADREAALALSAAAHAAPPPFGYSCGACGTALATWADCCPCGAAGQTDWTALRPAS